MTTNLNGKVALVTGAAGGMGSAIARVLAQHGAAVVIADLRDELGHKFEREITEADGTATYRWRSTHPLGETPREFLRLQITRP